MKNLALYFFVIVFVLSLLFLNWDDAFVLTNTLVTPSSKFWIGTDIFGRPIVPLLLKSLGNSLIYASLAMTLIFPIAFLCGISLSLSPKYLEALGSSILNLSISFSSLLIALIVMTILPPGKITLLITIVIILSPGLIRAVKIRAQEILNEEYVGASRAIGASSFHVARAHVIPRTFDFIVVKLPHLFIRALLIEATLSFMGIGAPLEESTIGNLMHQGRIYLIEAPHIALATGGVLFATMMSIILIFEKLGYK